MRLHLGAGRNHKDGWTNVDLVGLPGIDLVCDLDGPELAKVLDENSVTESLGMHFLEHLEHPLEFMQALWHVTEPDGRAFFEVPYGSSDDAWEDPTHRRPYFMQSFGYFSQPFYWRSDYGFTADWRVVSMQLQIADTDPWQDRPEELWSAIRHQRNVVHAMRVELAAVKPVRAADRELQERLNVAVVGPWQDWQNEDPEWEEE